MSRLIPATRNNRLTQRHSTLRHSTLRHSTQRRVTRRGLTLLELLLALAISAFLMAAVAMAMELHFRALDTRRSQVEEANLARAVLKRMADDLRGAVKYVEVDTEAIDGATELAAEEATGVDPSDLDPADLAEIENAVAGETAEGEPSEDVQDIAGSTVVPVRPGLYGNQFEFQVDVSRLPRIDQYQASLNTSVNVTDIPSDVKTVAYYLTGVNAPAAGATGVGASAMPGGAVLDDNGEPAMGLVRRELDRAVTTYAATSGLQATGNATQILAPEITRLQFQYFNGFEWFTEWDSAAQSGLPVAVEISLAIRRADAEETSLTSGFMPTFTADGATSQEIFYRMIVQIPVAEPFDPEAAAAEEEAALAEEEAAAAEAGEGT